MASQPTIIIPARGGSKRIAAKNIRPFLGVPMIARAIATAREAFPDAEIIVSTDSQDIAQVAKDAGARVPFIRPADLSDDYTGTTPVIAHAVSCLNLPRTAAVCCLYSTTPLLQPQRLVQGYRALYDHPDVAFVFAAHRFGAAPQRGFVTDQEGNAVAAMPEHIFDRTQDLEPWYHDIGQFYWGRAQSWRKADIIFNLKTRFVVLDHDEACDIDTMDDWREAERLYLRRQNDDSVSR